MSEGSSAAVSSPAKPASGAAKPPNAYVTVEIRSDASLNIVITGNFDYLRVLNRLKIELPQAIKRHFFKNVAPPALPTPVDAKKEPTPAPAGGTQPVANGGK